MDALAHHWDKNCSLYGGIDFWKWRQESNICRKLFALELLDKAGVLIGWDNLDETRGNGRRKRVDKSEHRVNKGIISTIRQSSSFLRVLVIGSPAHSSACVSSLLRKDASTPMHWNPRLSMLSVLFPLLGNWTGLRTGWVQNRKEYPLDAFCFCHPALSENIRHGLSLMQRKRKIWAKSQEESTAGKRCGKRGFW